jgi:heparinase II/III-like protein
MATPASESPISCVAQRNHLTRALQIVRHLGGGWLAFRILYAARVRLGILRRRTPVRSWSDIPLSSFLRDGVSPDPVAYRRERAQSGVRFFFGGVTELRSSLQKFPFPKTADSIGEGCLPYFDGSMFDTGSPPDWFRNPQTGERMPADRHWSEVEEYGSGDIKMIWEPSRFLFAYALVRAYARTGHDPHAETFWSFVEDWRDKNPPNAGPNWRCGQETAVRVFSWCFGLFGFLQSPATTDARVVMLVQMIAASGQRIAANIDYALSQKNNHGISEAAGLFTIGVLFPELKAAEKWRETGRKLLERQVRELLYEDGSFSQQSMNYERFVLQVLVWAMRLGELNRAPLSAEISERVSRAARFLFELQDATTGRLPHYGHNDGALIRPLTGCEARDFRPAIAAATYIAQKERTYESGPWDEELLWLFGTDALSAPVRSLERTGLRADAGGYYTLRAADTFAFIRAPKYRHRPAQADVLHTDIWWRGVNVAMDAGTFSYNTSEPLGEWLSGTRSHNTISMDGQDQMSRVSRFLWLPWPKSGVTRDVTSGRLGYIEAFHDGYRRLDAHARHRRGVLCLEDEWLIIDRIEGSLPHEFTLHWLLNDLPYAWDAAKSTVRLHSEVGDYFVRVMNEASATLIRASPTSPRGWFAPSYSVRAEALSLTATVRSVHAFFITLFSPRFPAVEWVGQRLIGSRWEVDLAPGGLVQQARCGADLLQLDSGSKT